MRGIGERGDPLPNPETISSRGPAAHPPPFGRRVLSPGCRPSAGRQPFTSPALQLSARRL